MQDKIIIFFILFMTLFLFIWGKLRYDVVAIIALLAATVTKLVPANEAFAGFGHPAVITVAVVLAISTSLQNAGIVDFIYNYLSKFSRGFLSELIILNVLIAVISAFMNNIGALAILLPLTMQIARKNEREPSEYLIPVAFSSLLGGMITLIGTPPNIIVAIMRAEATGTPFGMFDFAPVGIGVSIAGVLFLSIAGWRLIPKRKGKTLKEELFEVEAYLTELKVEKESISTGKTIREFEKIYDGDVSVLGIVRKKKHINTPSGYDKIAALDILIVEVDPEILQKITQEAGVTIDADSSKKKDFLGEEDVVVIEAVVKKDSPLARSSAGQLRLRWRYGINLLAVSRAGKSIKKRLSKLQIQTGDVLLLRGNEQSINEALPQLGFLPLQQRGLTVGEPRRMLLSMSIFALSILSVATGFLQIQIAFTLALVTMYLFGLIKLKEIYESIEWPIIILLGAMIPVGNALETTGAAALIADQILWLGNGQSPVFVLATILIGTMFLSDVVNNATAAVLMVPIALSIATGLNVSPDPFLMSVAIGASCPFLTPIGHQCNTLILGPGGYRFEDYWRVGLPLEVIIVAVSIPLLLWFWPMQTLAG